jgi:hypothetical protein
VAVVTATGGWVIGFRQGGTSMTTQRLSGPQLAACAALRCGGQVRRSDDAPRARLPQ